MLVVALLIVAYLAIFFDGVRADSNLTCTDVNGAPEYYTDTDGYTYQYVCMAQYGENDDGYNILYNSSIATTLSACIKTCSDWNIGRPSTPCQGIKFTSSDICLLVSAIYGFGEGSYTIAIPRTAPKPQPATPVSFNATCGIDGMDSFQHYIDPEGFTYYTLCDKQNQMASYQEVLSFDPPDITGCIRACSLTFLSSYRSCLGVAYDPVKQICYLDSADLGTVVDGPLISAYVLESNSPCQYNISSQYVTPEGDISTIKSLNHLDQSGVLSTTTQSTACGCAEQCSLYNLAYPNNTESCVGAEFDEDPNAKPNCYVRSR